MNQVRIGLITTLLLGIFIMIGALLAFVVKRKQKVVDFSLGLAFGVILMLIVTDLLPEIIELFGLHHIFFLLLFTVLGFVLLKILDQFIPDHEEEKMTKKELKNNLVHIGIVTSCALILHNMIEGMAVYSTILTDATLGLAVTLGIGFHNVPLGMVIAATFYQSNESMAKTLGVLALVSFSTFLGGLLMFFLNITTIHSLVLGILLSITLGMLIFIAFDELFPRIKETKNKKISYLGMGIGIFILCIAYFL